MNQANPQVLDFFKNANKYYMDHFSQEINPEGVIEYLRMEGIEKAVTLAEYNPESSGVVTNEFISSFCAGHDELVPIASIDFQSPVPFGEQARIAVNELGMKGFKFLPSYAYYYPTDQRLYPVYSLAQEMGLPVMFHTGTSIFIGTRVKYADPLILDDVACDFPKLNMLLEHGGRPFWYDRVAWMLLRHANVHVGVAGIPAKHLYNNFKHIEKYSDRFIFGSDWPGIPDIHILAEKIMDLPISREVKEKIFYRNAAGILGLP
jgi:predicted TIM-barrel fold metal-dependent hydrolase